MTGVTAKQKQQYDHVVVPRTLIEAYRKIADCVRYDDYYKACQLVEFLDDLGMD